MSKKFPKKIRELEKYILAPRFRKARLMLLSVSIGFKLIGLYFLSSTITGHSVSNLNNTETTFVGFFLFLLGLIGLGCYISLFHKKENKLLKICSLEERKED